MSITQKDKLYVGRSGEYLPIEITKAQGSYIWSNKKRYIDFWMGWNVGNIGWNNKYVLNKLKKFKGPNYVTPKFVYKRWIDLAKLLAKITPGKLTTSFRATGGTEAVEVAMQAAIRHTKRTKFISLEESYHGHSFGALSIGNSSYRKMLPNLLPGCHKIKTPLNRQAALKIEKLLKKEDIAAYIAEPIVCALAMETPTQEYYDILTDACKKYNTLLIMDEVASGFGTMGKLFASEHYKLKPDIMTVAKGLSGGYGAIGATITTKKVAQSIKKHPTYSTFGWLPLDTEGAIANIEYILKNKLWKRAEKMESFFEEKINKMNFKQKPELRIKGLGMAIRFKKQGYAQQIRKKAIQKGLIFPAGRYAISMFPALTIEKSTAEQGLNILAKSL